MRRVDFDTAERNYEERMLWLAGEDPPRHGPSAEDCDEPEECTCPTGSRCLRFLEGLIPEREDR